MQWLADLLVDNAPRTYRGDKDWGEQKKLWAGVKVKFDGLRPKTHRRWREANHGRWMRYEVTLPPTSARRRAVADVRQVHEVVDPQTGQKGYRIESIVIAPMTFAAQVQRWNRGVKLYSMTIRGEMRLRLTSTSTVAFVADYSEVPPALVLDPTIEAAHLTLEHFEVDRVSKIGGDVAEEWGELLEDVIRDKFLEEQNQKLAAKLNKSINKSRDDLRLSLADWLADL